MKQLLIFSFLFFVPLLYGEGEWRSVGTDPTARREGNDRIGILLIVDSVTARSPYADVSWNDGATGQKDQFRSITIQNTSPYDVLCATYAAFLGSGPSWTIPQSTGSFTSYNYATFYMIVSGGTASSQTVRGVIERQK